MKNFICLLCIGMFLVVCGCQQTTDIEKERAAIIEVINAETTAFVDYNFDGVAAHYSKDSLTIRLSAGRDDYSYLEGWEDVAGHLHRQIEDEEVPSDTHVSVEKSNYKMKIYPGSAWVVCDEKWTYDYETGIVEISSIQVRFLEKIDGEWKISFLSFVGTSGYDALDDYEE